MPNIGAPELVILIILVAFIVSPLVGVIALVDISRRSEAQFTEAGQSRTTWLIVAVLTLFVPGVVLGAVYYLFAVRTKLPARRPA